MGTCLEHSFMQSYEVHGPAYGYERPIEAIRGGGEQHEAAWLASVGTIERKVSGI